jgi:hypothetical protein
LLGKKRNCGDNGREPRETASPRGGGAARVVRRNETWRKDLNPHGIAKSAISPGAPNEALAMAKRKRRFRFRFAWLRFVSSARGELRRERIRLESATGFGA